MPVLIVQLSDMHVSKPGKRFGGHVDSREAFARAVARVRSLDPQPDVVLLSGDLAETGAPEEYDFIAEQLRQLSCPVVAIPGNHDDREQMMQKLPQSVTRHGGHLSFVDKRFPVCLIGLDTIVPGSVHGELCAQRLAWLRGALSDNSGKPVLLAMHHPPFLTGLRAMDNYGIKRGLEEFTAIVAEHTKRILAIVCGHAHRMIAANISGVPVLLAPSSCFPFELDLGDRPSLNFVAEPAQFMVHTWSREAGFVSHAAFVDEFPGPFKVI